MKLIKQFKKHIGSPSLMFLMFHLIAPHLHAQAIEIVETCSQLVCFPTPLTQASFADGSKTLTESGNYILCEDVMGDLIITDSGISVDLNNRNLQGIVTISGSDVVVYNGFIRGSATPAFGPLRGPVNPAVITIDGTCVNVYLKNLVITSADATGQDINNNGNSSLDGILNNGTKTFILDCNIQTGNGAPGGAGTAGKPAGQGGNSGTCINSNGSTAQIFRTLARTGNAGDGGGTKYGGMNPNAASGGISGKGIVIYGPLSFVVACEVLTGAGGNGSSMSCGNGGNGGDSGDGIFCMAGSDAQIRDCTSRTGNAGNGGLGVAAMNNAGGNGGDSGHALHTQGTQVINNVASTGDAGNGANGGKGGNGGNAGYALFVDNACSTQTRYLVVEYTGQGGNGGNALTNSYNGGNGGNGGDAVHITEGSRHTEVRFSTLSNTGEGGTGGAPATGGMPGMSGAPGRAVTDMNEDLCSLDPQCTLSLAPSAIFENFASGIADNDIRYFINGQGTESGKASNKSCNRLDNVFVDCDVNEVFDICQALDTVESTLTACCENILEKIEETACCECDFFITQSTTGIRNHLVNDPITEPGVYCLTESVTGNIIIQTDNVTINFNGYTLTAASPGVVSDGNNHVQINGGTITGAYPAAIDIQHGFDVSVTNMTFINNTKSVYFDNIIDFTIQQCIFTQNSDTAIDLNNSSNGKINNCQLHDNENLQDTLTLISTDSCQQLGCDTIIITNNNAPTLMGINAFNTHESSFSNIAVTSNSATIALQGIRLENCDNNTLTTCNINKNSAAANNATLCIGIEITASVDGGSKSNTINNCQIHENSIISQNIETIIAFFGISIASALNDVLINEYACSNCTIQYCSIQNNECITSTNSQADVFIGINVAGAVFTRTTGGVGSNSGQNCTIANCTVNNNTIVNRANAGLTAFIGISIANGLFIGGIGDHAGINSSINNCTVNNNSTSDSVTIFIGISLASATDLSAIASNCCDNGLIDNCTVNNNNTNEGATGYFTGISLASAAGAGILPNTCSNCTINNVAINSNNNNKEGFSNFIGINCGGAIDGLIENNACPNCAISNCAIQGNSCSQSSAVGNSPSFFIGINLSGIFNILAPQSSGCSDAVLKNIYISENTLTSPSNASFLYGIFMNGAASDISPASPGGCNNITVDTGLIESNSVATGTGPLYGFYINGPGTSTYNGGCNNIILTSCAVQNNSAIGDSQAYTIIGSNPEDSLPGAQNIQLDGCTATGNTSASSLINSHGFVFESSSNAILQQCMSVANTTDGFRLSSVVDSCLRECKALNNGGNGFSFEGTTNNVTITNSQSLGNTVDGLTFLETTTHCFIRENIAQNNVGTGFNNLAAMNAHLFVSNFAQANGTNYSVHVPLVKTQGAAMNPYANIQP